MLSGEKKPMTRENLANYGFIRYMGLYDDILSNILGPNEDGEVRERRRRFM